MATTSPPSTPSSSSSSSTLSPAELAARAGLAPVGGRPGLGAYLRGIWERRWFAWHLARARVHSENSLDRLGILWKLLEPLLLAMTYLFIFGVLVPGAAGIENFAAYLAIGVFTFHFMSKGVGAGARSLSGNPALVRSLQFPRALLPLVATLQQVILLGPTLLVLVGVVLVTGERPSVSWLWVPVVFAVQALFTVGLGMALARLFTHSHDLQRLLPTVMRMWFYLSGVFWTVDRVAGVPLLQAVFEFNPGYVFIHLNRQALLPSTEPSAVAGWPLALAWTGLALVGGLLYLWRGEHRYGRPT